jgi:ferredoxin-type protein NapG
MNEDGISRRGFIRPARREPVLPIRRRPPGALPEETFLARCTACGDCIKACPHNAIHVLAEWVKPGTGTPVMVPDSRACHMCEGFPCAAACGEGALAQPQGPWFLGTVSIDIFKCLPFRGPECGACAGLCPSGADALRLRRGRPEIDPERCVGCGLCIEACPVKPSAIKLDPL